VHDNSTVTTRQGTLSTRAHGGTRSLFLGSGGDRTQIQVPADMTDDQICELYDIDELRYLQPLFDVTTPYAVDGPMQGQTLYASPGNLGDKCLVWTGGFVYTYEVSRVAGDDGRDEARFIDRQPVDKRRPK
jgi:hypothetical protein